MVRPRIFVSHTNNCQLSAEYVDSIETTLSDAGFDVLVDRTRLQPGALWRNEIYTWMGLCNGAVVLASDAAVQAGSIWVPREASILLWRRTLDRDFVLVPVCLGAVTPADLNTGVFADMHLGEVQAAPSLSPQHLADALLLRFARLALPKTPLETLAGRLVEVLRSASEDTIFEAAENLHIELGPWSPLNDPRQTLAIALLHFPLRESIRAIEVLAETMEPAKADQILAMIAPSWVDLCAARWLADSGHRRENKPAVVLNASTRFCAEMYVHRASCRPPKTRWPMVATSGVYGERVAEEIAAEIEQNLIAEFRLADDSYVPNVRQRLQLLLEQRQIDGRPVFVSLPFSAGLARVLPQLQRSMPSVTFVLLSGDDFPPRHVTEHLHVRLVEPKLAPGAELSAQRDFDYARSIIRPQSTGAY